MPEKDLVEQYIEVKNQLDNLKEKEKALQIILLDRQIEHLEDKRLIYKKGAVTKTLKETVYEGLAFAGIETTITETRLKKLEEFDEKTQEQLIKSDENFDIKIASASVSINKNYLKKLEKEKEEK